MELCYNLCRKCAEKSPIAPMDGRTLSRITRNLSQSLRERYPACVSQLLKEASAEYETSLRSGKLCCALFGRCRLRQPPPKRQNFMSVLYDC